MSKKALITGSSGFIGKHLVRILKEIDIVPVGLSRDYLYSPVPQLIEIIADIKPDYIIALHGYGNHRQQTDPTQIIMANYWATYNLLKATEFLDYEAFINVATSSMYGKQMHAMSEDCPLLPDTMYTATKAGAMYLARAFAMEYNKPIVTVVPFSVYGTGEASHRFIPLVCEHLVTQENMSINSKAPHSWIYVTDFINGILKAIENVSSLKGQMLNVGSEFSYRNRDIVKTLEKISGKKLKFTDDFNARSSDSPIWQANTIKLESLGWKQQIAIHEGLTKCWEYYDKKQRTEA